MEKLLEESLLYDFYSELLTEHQKQVYQDFVMGDLSLGEIAQERGISRQGVHDMVRRTRRQLMDYESRLHLVSKFLRIRETAERINRLSQDILSHAGDSHLIGERIRSIRKLTEQIVEEL